MAENSKFTNCTFENNQAYYSETSKGAKGLEVLSCELFLNFTDCTFKDNLAKYTTANVYLNRGQDVLFSYCTFINTYTATSGSALKGSFLQLIAESNVTIISSTFTSGHAMQGGAIFLLGDSSANISASKFIDNTAEKRGGAICAESFSTLIIENGCVFYNNEASNETGDSIYA